VCGVCVELDADAELLKCLDHVLCVVADQQIADVSVTLSDRG
jgi:hypothetical protein